MPGSKHRLTVLVAPGTEAAVERWATSLASPSGLHLVWIRPGEELAVEDLDRAAAVLVEWPRTILRRNLSSWPDLAVIGIGNEDTDPALERLRDGADAFIRPEELSDDTVEVAVRMAIQRRRQLVSEESRKPSYPETLLEGWWEWNLRADRLRLSPLWSVQLNLPSSAGGCPASEVWRRIPIHHRGDLRTQIQAVRRGIRSLVESELQIGEPTRIWFGLGCVA